MKRQDNAVLRRTKIQRSAFAHAFNAAAPKLVAGLSIGLSSAAFADVLAGWDVSGRTTSNYSASPYAATASGTNVTVGGLTLGSGVGTQGSGSAATWGASGFATSSKDDAITANDFITFTLTGAANQSLSLSSISPFWAGRSSNGANNGALQYSLNGSTYTDVVTTLTYATTAASQDISLSSVSALQNIAAGTTVTFRIVNWRSGSPTGNGNWYIANGATGTGTAAYDFVVNGSVAPAVAGNIYFDLNGAADGSGVTDGGTYTFSAATFNNAAGGAGTVGTFTSGQTATFSAGTDAAGKIYTVNIDTAVSTNGLVFEEGDVTLAHATSGSLTLTGAGVSVAGSATISESIAGAAGLTKTGTGTLRLSGSNTYTGLNTISAGVLSVAADNSLGAAANGLTFGGGTLQATADVTLASTRAVNGAGKFDIAENTTLTVNGLYGATTSGLLTLNNVGTLELAGATKAAAGINFSAPGTLRTTGSALTLTGDIVTLHTTGTATIAGAMANGSSNRVITASDGDADVDLNLSANLSGSGYIDLYGPGTIQLGGTNTYTGATYLNGNTVIVSADANLGANSSRLDFYEPNSTLKVNGNVTFASRSVTGYGGFDIAPAATLTVNGSYGGTGTNWTGPQLLTLKNAGTLQLANASTNAAAGVTFSAPGTLNVSGAALAVGGNITTTHTTGQATISGAVNLGSAARTISVANGAADQDLVISAALSGQGTGSSAVLTKTGAGKLVLSGANTYGTTSTTPPRGTSILGGTLVASNTSGSATGVGPVSVGDGTNPNSGVLAGTGTASSTTIGVVGNTGQTTSVLRGGTITGGSGATGSDAVGKLTIQGTTALNGGGAYAFKIANTDGSTVPASQTANAGTNWDKIQMTTLNLAGVTSANPFTIKILTLSSLSFAQDAKFEIANISGTTVQPNITDLFVINTDGLGIPSNQFSIVTGAAGSGEAGYDLFLSYNGSGAQSAPEPGTAALIGLGASAVLGRRRRRSA